MDSLWIAAPRRGANRPAEARTARTAEEPALCMCRPPAGPNDKVALLDPYPGCGNVPDRIEKSGARDQVGLGLAALGPVGPPTAVMGVCSRLRSRVLIQPPTGSAGRLPKPPPPTAQPTTCVDDPSLTFDEAESEGAIPVPCLHSADPSMPGPPRRGCLRVARPVTALPDWTRRRGPTDEGVNGRCSGARRLRDARLRRYPVVPCCSVPAHQRRLWARKSLSSWPRSAR